MRISNSLNFLKKHIESSDFPKVLECIMKMKKKSDLMNFIEQKIYRKIYTNNNFINKEKRQLKEVIVKNYHIFDSQIINYLTFVEIFSDVSSKLYNEMTNTISLGFDSLMLFSCCLDQYVCNEKEDILFARNFLFNIATKVLHNDIQSIGYAGISLSLKDFYNKKRSIILQLIDLATEYGAITEQYDDISYGVRKISEIQKLDDSTVYAKLNLVDTKKETLSVFNAKYEDYLYNLRKEALLSEVYDFYKCMICRELSIKSFSSKDIDYGKLLIEQAFLMVKPLDYLFFISNSYPSYILSIVAYIYTKLICMYFDIDSYKIIKLDEIKRSMLFSNHISEQVFIECIQLLTKNDLRNKNRAMKTFYPFIFLDENTIFVCKWMLSNNFNLIGDVIDICFNSSKSSQLGIIVNRFGKFTYDKIVKSRLEKNGWQVIENSIVIKSGNQQLTDIDLVAYKNNLLLVGQLKVAHSGFSTYQKWKAEKSVLSGIAQCDIVNKYLKNNIQSIAQILKEHKIIEDYLEVENIISVVITGSNFFTGIPNEEGVSIIGIEMLDELLYYEETIDPLRLVEIIKNPQLKYNMDEVVDIVYSQISTTNFTIVYEEVE